MKPIMIGVITGVLSGLCTYAASVYLLARTSALVMPRGFPLVMWQSLIVFGLGAFAVALVIHLLALRLSSSRVLPSLLGFMVSIIATLAISGLWVAGQEALLAWSLGAVLASAICAWLRSNPSAKATREKLRAA